MINKIINIEGISLDDSNLLNDWINKTMLLSWLYKKDKNDKIIGVISYPSFFSYKDLGYSFSEKLENTLGKGKMFFWCIALEQRFFPEYFDKSPKPK